MSKSIRDIKKRPKKSILHNIEKLVNKYGFQDVRLVVNKYFKKERDKSKLIQEVKQRERELEQLKKKL